MLAKELGRRLFGVRDRNQKSKERERGVSSEVWLPIATLVLGIVLGYVADWLREARSSKHERQEQWEAFQRETILEAQDAIGTIFKVRAEISKLDQTGTDRETLWEGGYR